MNRLSTGSSVVAGDFGSSYPQAGFITRKFLCDNAFPTCLAEIAERGDVPLEAGEPGRGVSATSRTIQPTQGDKS